MRMIPAKEYAARNGLNALTIAHKAARGGFESAQKIGNEWFIDEDEPNVDKRVKSRNYVNWRKDKK